MVKKFISFFAVLIFIISCCPLSMAQGDVIEPVPEVTAQNVYMVNMNTGAVVYEKGSDEKIYPASLTKLVTLLVAAETITDYSEIITVSDDCYDDLVIGSSSINLKDGEQMSLDDIMYAIAISSANEAANALASHLFGSVPDFVAKMNEKAAELGMDSTHFVTCTGLHDENHYTTVRDLTKLLSYALQNDTFRQIYCTSEYTTSATASAPEGLHFLSTMFKKMDSPAVNGGEIEGGKTGYTSEAGQCLASLAKVDDVEYILVTAGAPGGPSTEPYHIEDAKTVYNRIQAGEQGSVADTAADSQDDQATTETDEAA